MPWWSEFEESTREGPAVQESEKAPERGGSVPQEIDVIELRRTFGTFATGVTAVCARDANGVTTGAAVSSFTPVSLAPPLVSVCLRHPSTTLDVIRGAGTFAVSVLAVHHEVLCRQLAGPGPDRLASVDWAPAPSGAPVIGQAVSWFDCAVFGEHEAGDHTILIGRVTGMAIAEEPPLPLLFHRSELRGLDVALRREGLE